MMTPIYYIIIVNPIRQLVADLGFARRGKGRGCGVGVNF